MKKLASLALAVLMATAPASMARADFGPSFYTFPEGTQLSPGSLNGTLTVYSAPTDLASPMGAGEADALYALSGEEDWALISYEDSRKQTHLGWADLSSLTYEQHQALPMKDPLGAAYLETTLAQATPIWDSFDIHQAPVAQLAQGDTVTYLCWLEQEESGKLAYVMADTALGRIWGFVPYDALDFN